jgi:hypothetical protein
VTESLLLAAPSEEQPESVAVPFPSSWLAEQAPALYYRAAAEVLRDPEAAALAAHLPYSSPSALLLALTQHPDGTWNERMLSVPPGRAESFEGVGTVPAVQRLLEYGWSRESPPVQHARRLLFRLLAEDDDPGLLYELRTRQTDEELARRGRGILREAAAATLAQAGFEADPRLRGAARRVIERLDAFLHSPLAEKPWIRVGNKQVLAPDAYPPSFYSLRLLAHMPLLRHEHYATMELLYEYLAQPLPRQDSAQLFGKKILPQPHLVLGDHLPHRNAVEADVPAALLWLETMARLNFLRRNENWSKLFERFLDDCDKSGVWHPHKGHEAPRSTSPFVWPMFPLTEVDGADTRWVDVTFRIGLIARLSGRATKAA